MIDDEDEEEILTKKPSFKSVLKNLVLALLIVVGATFIYLGGQNQFVGFFLICLGATLIQVQKQTPEPIRQTLSILKCGICGITSVRHYETGDYVFRTIGSCEKCNQPMKIDQIYSVKLKKPTTENKEPSNKKVKKEK